MLSTIVIIASISLGSVWMDSNLEEFCAKNYFHSFVANYSKGRTTLQLTRKAEDRNESYHSWVLPLQKNAKIVNATQIQYSSHRMICWKIILIFNLKFSNSGSDPHTYTDTIGWLCDRYECRRKAIDAHRCCHN